MSEQVICNYTYHSTERYCTRSRIAIITPRASRHQSRLQSAVARGLGNNLSNRTTACSTHGDGDADHSTVRIFENESEAMEWQPGCIIRVTPKKWRYLPMPVFSTWNAEAEIDVRFARSGRDSREYDSCFEVDARMRGRAMGFRRSSFPLSRIAYTIGRDVGAEVKEHLDRACRIQLAEDEPEEDGEMADG